MIRYQSDAQIGSIHLNAFPYDLVCYSHEGMQAKYFLLVILNTYAEEIIVAMDSKIKIHVYRRQNMNIKNT